jgi:hypothetical protein
MSIVTLKETAAVLELAETITTSALKHAMHEAVAETLMAVATELSGKEPETRGPSLYNQFISEMTDPAKKALPKTPAKQRFHILATLWTRHKNLGDLQDIKAAVTKDLKAFVPVYKVDITG